MKKEPKPSATSGSLASALQRKIGIGTADAKCQQRRPGVRVPKGGRLEQRAPLPMSAYIVSLPEWLRGWT